jgi:hypothetical protein
MQLTGGQSKFEFMNNGHSLSGENINTEELKIEQVNDLPIIVSSKDDINAHDKRLAEIEKKHSVNTIWRKF